MKLIIIGGLGCLGGVIIKERKPHSNWPTKLSKKLQPLININCAGHYNPCLMLRFIKVMYLHILELDKLERNDVPFKLLLCNIHILSGLHAGSFVKVQRIGLVHEDSQLK